MRDIRCGVRESGEPGEDGTDNGTDDKPSDQTRPVLELELIKAGTRVSWYHRWEYLHSLPGVGMISACKLIRKYPSIDKLVLAVRWQGDKKIPADYLECFHRAFMTFMHARVWCTQTNRMVRNW